MANLEQELTKLAIKERQFRRFPFSLPALHDLLSQAKKVEFIEQINPDEQPSSPKTETHIEQPQSGRRDPRDRVGRIHGR